MEKTKEKVYLAKPEQHELAELIDELYEKNAKQAILDARIKELKEHILSEMEKMEQDELHTLGGKVVKISRTVRFNEGLYKAFNPDWEKDHKLTTISLDVDKVKYEHKDWKKLFTTPYSVSLKVEAE